AISNYQGSVGEPDIAVVERLNKEPLLVEYGKSFFPVLFIVLVGFYGYILWTFALSFTNSTFLPSYKWVGLAQYARLMDNDRWWVASKNLAVFGGMFIAISLVIGVLLAVLLDQR
ncbi:binding-protein dependent transport system inner membrane protein, partial [Pseudomonas syringae pv. japonica str. M301072]